MFPERGSGGETPSPPEHKVHPVAIATCVAYPDTEFMTALTQQKDSIFEAPDNQPPSNTIAIHQVLVEVIDCEVPRSTDASGPCVIGSVAGIDGPMFGLPKFKDVRTRLMKVGYSQGAAEKLICDVVMRHLRFTGVNINKNYIHAAGNDSTNFALTDQFHGTARFITRHAVKTCQLMGAYIPTPTQAKNTKTSSLGDQGMWRPGQIPILLKPITVESMHAKWGRWLGLYAKNPGLHWDLVGTPSIMQMALGATEHAQVQAYKMAGVIFYNEFNRCADLGVYAQRPPVDSKDKDYVAGDPDIKGSYLFEQRKVVDTTDRHPVTGKYRINKKGNAPLPGLRAALHRHKTEARLAISGVDDWDDVVVATENETLAQIQCVLLNLIAPCDPIPGTFEGLVGKQFREDRATHTANKITTADILTMTRDDPRSTLLADAIRFNNRLTRAFLLTNMPNATDRSGSEFGEQLNYQGGFFANLAKTMGAKGMKADSTTELGRVQIAGDIVMNKGQKAGLQFLYSEMSAGCGISIRSNNTNALCAIYLDCNFRTPT